jgi:excisionase family DNA binding protein
MIDSKEAMDRLSSTAVGMSPRTVAHVLGVHRTSVYRYMNNGKLEFYVSGGRRFVPYEEVYSLLKQRGV